MDVDFAAYCARVGENPWEDSLPWDHMTLLVTLEERWLADVGFGDGFREPLLLDEAEFLQVLRERFGIEP